MSYNNRKISEEQYEGTMKWFNADKGYGFITPSKGINKNQLKSDIFVHISALIDHSGMSIHLEEEDRVYFNTEEGANGKLSAVNIKKCDM